MSPVNDGVSVSDVSSDYASQLRDCAAKTISLNLTTFDTRYYLDLIRTRGATIRRVVRALKPALGLRNAVDAGCGVGFFAQTLTELGLETRGFDGRFENVIEARKRFPKMEFECGDIESAEIAALGTFDLVLCFGLLYHLENPMRAIRHLRALTGKGLLIESMVVPGDDARMALREEPSQIDQSLTDMAFLPSEPCLVKMLYRAGFAHVYRVPRLPEHDQFRETGDRARRRTIVFASHQPARIGCLERVAEPPQGAIRGRNSVPSLGGLRRGCGDFCRSRLGSGMSHWRLMCAG